MRRPFQNRSSFGFVALLALGLSACGAAPTTPESVEPSPAAPIVSAAPAAAAASSGAVSTNAPPAQHTSESLTVSAEIQAFVDAPDRLPEDRLLDAGRKPAQLLTFYGVKPGMTVAELGAGGGYTSEFLARAVGPTGKVYGQNTKLILEKFAEKPWSERLKRPVAQNIVRVDREFDDPLPPEAKKLDLVLINLFYHDLYWMKVDRAKMNKAILAALKPGGIYAVVDHSAKEGAGSKDVETLHRIEQTELVRDIELAGFKLDKQSDFLRNPADTKDWSTSPRVAGEKRGTSDRFVLLFRKPG